MVIGAFPLAKLGTLLLKHVSKPIANVLKERAKQSPTFRKYICMPPAQFYNWCEVKTKMWILNLGKPVNIPVLNEAMAIELGANLLGEAIIFIIAAGILVNEYNRSARKEAATQAAKRKEMEGIRDALRDLFIQSEEHSAQIREIMRKLGEVDTTGTPKKENIGPKSPRSPPDCPAGNASPPENLTQSIVQHNETTHNSQRNNPLQSSIVLKAVDDIENQFWDYPLIERQTSVIILGLFYINKLFKFQE